MGHRKKCFGLWAGWLKDGCYYGKLVFSSLQTSHLIIKTKNHHKVIQRFAGTLW